MFSCSFKTFFIAENGISVLSLISFKGVRGLSKKRLILATSAFSKYVVQKNIKIISLFYIPHQVIALQEELFL